MNSHLLNVYTDEALMFDINWLCACERVCVCVCVCVYGVCVRACGVCMCGACMRACVLDGPYLHDSIQQK